MKPPLVQVLELKRRKPIEQVIAELEARHPRIEARAADLGVSTVTYRRWRENYVEGAGQETAGAA